MNGYTCQRCGNSTSPSHMDSDGYEVRYCGECGEYWIIDGGDDYDDWSDYDDYDEVTMQWLPNDL